MNNDSTKNYIYDAKKGGVFCDTYKVAPWPSFSWRRMAIFDCLRLVAELREATGKRFIEVGFGSGVLTYDFYLMGFECVGCDYSQEAVTMANNIFNYDKEIIDFRNEINEEDIGRYDCLGAFEVLEHIEEDGKALIQWRELLKPGGFLLLTVPAKMKYWGYVDLRSGHVRRYEKNELVSILKSNGFDVVQFVSWGFPLGPLTHQIRNLLIHKPAYKATLGSGSDDMRTLSSGIERAQEWKFKNYLPFHLIQILGRVQKLFYKYDLGTGYTVIAKKNNDEENL